MREFNYFLENPSLYRVIWYFVVDQTDMKRKHNKVTSVETIWVMGWGRGGDPQNNTRELRWHIYPSVIKRLTAKPMDEDHAGCQCWISRKEI